MNKEELIKRLRKLALEWIKNASNAVPQEYKDRNLEYKYLRGDNAAAGWIDCYDDLMEVIAKASLPEVIGPTDRYDDDLSEATYMME